MFPGQKGVDWSMVAALHCSVSASTAVTTAETQQTTALYFKQGKGKTTKQLKLTSRMEEDVLLSQCMTPC